MTDTNISELSNTKAIVFSAFEQMEEKLDVRIPRFFFEVLILFLSLNGKLNFLKLSRFSSRCEQSFRYLFEKRFDFLSFNISLLKMHMKERTAIAFDPSFISKSGKKTPGVGYFWSGCAGKAKWGLEFCGLAALDLSRQTGFHLFGFQTIDLKSNETLIGFYLRKLLEHKAQLLSISNYIVADAYFSKVTFVNPLLLEGFQVVSRLRDDADLQYIFNGIQKAGKGRNRKYDGKINFNKLKSKYLNLVLETELEKIYSIEAYSKSLKRTLNIVLIFTKNKNQKWSHKIYFSTDLNQDWTEIMEMYRQRFQIEFLYRDAKQFTGLNSCEARSTNKLHFHWNMSLTSINIAKIAFWIPRKDKNPLENPPFSMANIKTLFNNNLLISRFISMLGINPKLDKNKTIIKQLLEWGKIAS